MSTFKDLKGTSDQPFNRLVAVVLSICLGIAVFWAIDFFRMDRLITDLELKTYDIRAMIQQGDMANQPSKDIVIVKFDDPTLNNFEDEYGTWPWPRNVHAEMIDWLNDAGAKIVAYDIMFVSKQRGQEAQDQALIDSFAQNKNVYLSMNFDNNLHILRTLGKELRPEDYRLIKPLGINFESELKPSSTGFNLNATRFDLDESGTFFSNESMTFNNYRRIIPELLQVRDRIAFVNHGRDKDGVSRSNPLVFRLIWFDPVMSKNKPYRFHPEAGEWKDYQGRIHKGKWLDTQGKWVDESGCYMTGTETQGHCLSQPRIDYYPYLGLRLAMDLRYPDTEFKIILNTDGALEVYEKASGGKDVWKKSDLRIPLHRDGSMLIKWYNVNVDRLEDQMRLRQLEEHRIALMEKMRTENSDDLKLELQTTEAWISEIQKRFQGENPAKPYQEVSAWRILKAIKDEKSGEELTENDKMMKKSFKDKIVFIGTTAVSTYDIKTTPINKIMPGVVLQATVFDNIYQNTSYMRRLGDFENILITGLLCVISALVIIKLRSALAGMGLVMTIAGLYTLISVLLFLQFSLWINVAAPLVAITVITTLTYMVKYISRNRDYEQTYVMATTDAMTGLKNHRFFQEHLRESIQYADRFNGKFSLLLLDIDHFKKFNDTYGHQAGDEVLRAVARKLKNSVRSNDLVARYGGEEMAIVLDKANEQEALEVAQKVVRAVAEEAYPIAEGVSKHVTISVGVSTYPTHAKTPAELIEFSDQGLYRAKEMGRNRVGAQFDEDMPKKEEGDGEEKASA